MKITYMLSVAALMIFGYPNVNAAAAYSAPSFSSSESESSNPKVSPVLPSEDTSEESVSSTSLTVPPVEEVSSWEKFKMIVCALFGYCGRTSGKLVEDYEDDGKINNSNGSMATVAAETQQAVKEVKEIVNREMTGKEDK